jgi:hypothetical protein
MKLKHLLFVLSLTSTAQVFGASKNLCDDHIESKTTPEDQIQKCFVKYGTSDFYKEQEEKNKLKEEASKTEAVDTLKKKDNIETKKFNSDELLEAGFGKPFFAIQGDYRNHKYKEKIITKSNALCSYLGYEKAINSLASPELWENKDEVVKVDRQGLIIDTNMFGTIKKIPEIYRDEDYKFTVRKYTEITCIRRKDKELEGSEDVFKSIPEDFPVFEKELNTSAKPGETGVNNGPRSSSGKNIPKSPHGYKPSDWGSAASESK